MCRDDSVQKTRVKSKVVPLHGDQPIHPLTEDQLNYIERRLKTLQGLDPNQLLSFIKSCLIQLEVKDNTLRDCIKHLPAEAVQEIFQNTTPTPSSIEECGS